MYAIVEIAGKQYKVRENDRVYVPRQSAAPDEKLSFDNVLLVSSDSDIKVGTPTVEGASVDATVLQHVKADKVLVFKKKRRKRFKVKRGHRQPYTEILINAVDLSGKAKKASKKASASKADPAKDAAPAPKAAAPKADAPKVAAKTEAPKAAPKKEAAAKAEAPAKKTAAKPAPAKKAPAKKAPAKRAAPGGDDLKKIEGIGPKIASILAESGIDTFAAMAEATPDRIREILAEAGSRYRSANPDTWPAQAELAAKGDWDSLDTLQDELKGGRRVED